ncbi:MAG: Nramp family divalent metal transporter, partial [Planctomycetota bacterium]|nr:Nramp family divalent metal transporter [Planctomycetota bacterium]
MEHPPIDPPETFSGRLREIGPGIIVSGAIVGSGELIVTTKLGAEAGFVLLWLILFSCVIKVFLQIELGRYVVSSGHTVLEAFDRVPGPAIRIGEGRLNWMNALWCVMTACAACQVGGILLGLALVFQLPALGLGAAPEWVWAIGFALLAVGLLSSGRYGLVERTTA